MGEKASPITVWTGCVPSTHFEKGGKKQGKPTSISKVEAKEIMGIPPEYEMTLAEIGEAVPPVYSHYIAKEAIRQMRL